MKLFKSIESAPVDSPVVDLEQALLDLEIADIELTDLFEDGAKIAHSYEMYALIVDTIEKSGGVTKSLEAMFGENFSSVDAMQSEASAEAFEWAEKAWNWIITFFKKMWAWVSSLWTSTDSVRAQLRELKGKAAQVTFPVKIKRSKDIRDLKKQIDYIDLIKAAVKNGTNMAEFDKNAAAMAAPAEQVEEVEIKDAAGLVREIEMYEAGFTVLFNLREDFEEIQKEIADKSKPVEPAKPAEGEQPAEGAAAPANPNAGKFAELQGKVIEIGKLVRKGNRALVVASKMLIAVCKVK